MLFVVLLGGAHPKANLELHDVVFATGSSLEATYPQLQAAWFGQPGKVHMDGWMEVRGADGYRIEWSADPAPAEEPKLYFAHLGGYQAGSFGEAHHCLLVAATSQPEAKARAKKLAPASWQSPHVDAIFAVAPALAAPHAEGLHLRLVQGDYPSTLSCSEYRTFPPKQPSPSYPV